MLHTHAMKIMAWVAWGLNKKKISKTCVARSLNQRQTLPKQVCHRLQKVCLHTTSWVIKAAIDLHSNMKISKTGVAWVAQGLNKKKIAKTYVAWVARGLNQTWTFVKHLQNIYIQTSRFLKPVLHVLREFCQKLIWAVGFSSSQTWRFYNLRGRGCKRFAFQCEDFWNRCGMSCIMFE